MKNIGCPALKKRGIFYKDPYTQQAIRYLCDTYHPLTRHGVIGLILYVFFYVYSLMSMSIVDFKNYFFIGQSILLFEDNISL